MSVTSDDAILAEVVKDCPRKMGQPSKMTFRRLRRIIKAVEGGTPVKYAVSAGGVGYTTFYEWCDKWPKLTAVVQRARNRAVSSMVKDVRYGVDIKGNPDWKSRAWLLERTAKDEFSAPKATETTVNVQNNSLTLNLSGDQMKHLAEQHAAAMARLAPMVPVVVASLNNGAPDTTSAAPK